jgi:hypothetical protein
LTTEVLSHYKGGQLRIFFDIDRSVYRGEIADVSMENGDLKVKFTWLAKEEDDRWVNNRDLDYELTLYFDKGRGQALFNVRRLNKNRLEIRTVFLMTAETLIFYTPDDEKLDPTEVEGLVIAT